MKRLASSDDSLGALMSMCPTSDDNSPRTNQVYSREFQSILDGLDEEGCVEEAGGHVSEKKRRLSVDQVKALEKNFEIENKLEPERKVKLAQELGLQPRQVAVWFQNRRARWKTKQLERDYGVLKANYDSLKANFENLQHDNEALRREIRELESKINGENSNAEGNLSVKEEVILPENNIKTLEQSEIMPAAVAATSEPLSYENLGGASIFPDMKDGSSDSDSSAILNEDNSPNAAICQPFLMSPAAATSSSPPSSSMNCFQFGKTTSSSYQAPPPQHYVKMEEHNFFSAAEETCNFFSDEQAPSLHWYCPEQWN